MRSHKDAHKNLHVLSTPPLPSFVKDHTFVSEFYTSQKSSLYRLSQSVKLGSCRGLELKACLLPLFSKRPENRVFAGEEGRWGGMLAYKRGECGKPLSSESPELSKSPLTQLCPYSTEFTYQYMHPINRLNFKTSPAAWTQAVTRRHILLRLRLLTVNEISNLCVMSVSKI